MQGHDFIRCSYMRLEAPMIFMIKRDLLNWTILWMQVIYIIIHTNKRDCVREAIRTTNITRTFSFHCMGSHSYVRLASPWWLPSNDARTGLFYIPDFDFKPEHDNFYDSILLLLLNNVIQFIIYTRTDLSSDLTFPYPSFLTGCGSMTKHFIFEILNNLDSTNNLNWTFKFNLKLIIELLIIILIFLKYND